MGSPLFFWRFLVIAAPPESHTVFCMKRDRRTSARRLFSLPKPFWKLSDEEYVERIRTSAGGFVSWYRIFAAIYALVAIASIVIVLNELKRMIDLPADVGRTDILFAYMFGGMCGGFLVSVILSAVLVNVKLWSVKLRCRIILTSWDRARELEAFIEQNRLTPPPAASAKP